MLVKDHMLRHPFMLNPEMAIMEAQQVMNETHLRHVPVVGEGKRLLGLVTRRSLLIDPGSLGSLSVWDISRHLAELKVKKVMIPAANVITIQADIPIEDAARIMVEKKIGCLPVLEDQDVVGLINSDDLLKLLTRMMTTDRDYLRVSVLIPNEKGELAKLVGAIGAKGWGLRACGGIISGKDASQYIAVLKLDEGTPGEIEAIVAQIEGQEILDLRKT